MNSLNYECLKCGHRFLLPITDAELATRLDSDREDQCPECAQRVGVGPVKCRNCATAFEIEFPHWHVQCTLAHGACPVCGVRCQSLCNC